ncbi:3-deoxy-D-manno-octulosonic acid transferase [Rhodobacter sp. KR11]|uniref:3-deoxy-D-manno-octulosonic acid transferase n=1 Tax=Rhodobacter sp. KR11 TaxID=2974588 RepID=UPI0022223C56|nr:glycosyltransferase N-terminal domain-containing protein [Rhodobacter sp. KR11]MCW1918279.1 3-deoxy-D-manno-octulosonic acid transferase [Rhodobacter sp. KR11]
MGLSLGWKSVGLTLYNLGARPEGVQNAPPPRPGGSVVWCHAPGEALAPMLELARRLIDEDGVTVLVTCDGQPATAALVQPAPLDFPRDVAAFLDHWRPDVAVMGGGELRPALIHEAAARRIKLLMVEARAPWIGRQGFFPGLVKASLGAFARVLAVDEAAARALRKAGVEGDRLMVTGRMEEPSAALPHVERDRAALAQSFATRPVWLAADIAVAEEAAVITAHREALRLAHRLLLILVPRNPDRADALAQAMEAEGWRVACRAHDQDPDGETEAYIVSDAEYGLWYRLAPVTFLGGSLEGDGCRRNPMETAAMGSAILCGPKPGAWGTAFGRLAAARAARMVGSGADLAQALGDLLSPDRAARQAQAAWGIASEGAEVTERVMGLVRNVLDGEAL